MKTTALEERLRDAYRSAATDLDPVLASHRHAEPSATAPLQGIEVIAPQRWRRRTAVLVTVAAVIVAGLIAVGVTTSTSRRPTPISPSGIPADGPAWYRLLRPLLPDGFDHVAVSVDDPATVHFIILDDVGHWLSARMSRVPIPDDPSGANLPKVHDADGTWFEEPSGYNLVTTAGLQIAANCTDTGANPCNDPAGATVAPARIRQLVADLAHRFPVADLPTESSGTVDANLLTTGMNILSGILTDSEITASRIGTNDGASQFTQWNVIPSVDPHNASPIPDGANFTTLHVIAGLYPPPASTTTGALHLDGKSDTAFAFLPNGTAIRIVTDQAGHRGDIQRALEQIVATTETSATTPASNA